MIFRFIIELSYKTNMDRPTKIAVGIVAATAVLAVTYVALRSSGEAAPKKSKKSRSTKGSRATSPTKKATPETEEKKDTSETLRVQGNKKFGQQEFVEAIGLYSRAIAASPESDGENIAKCYANRAFCHIKLGNFLKGIEDCTSALKYDAQYIKALQRRAGAHESLNQLDEAIDDYMMVMKLAMPSNPTPNNVTKQQEEGMVNIERVLKVIAGNKAKIGTEAKIGQFPSVTILRSYFETFLLDPVKESEEEIHARINGGDETGTYTLGEKYIEDGRFQDALDIFNKILEEQPGHYLAMVNKATLLHLSGNIAKALECFEAANAIKADDPHTNVRWANALMFNSDTNKSNELLEKAIASNPNDTVALFHSGEASSVQGKFTEAIDFYTKVIEIDPSHYEAYNHRGLAYMSYLESMGEAMQFQQPLIDLAKQTFLSAIKLKPNKADAYNNYGLLLALFQQNDQAIQQFDIALSVDPNNSTAYTRKGFLSLQGNGDFNTALEMFEKAIALDENNIEAHCNLSLTLLTMNKIDEAIACYDRAIEFSSVLSLDLPQIYYYRETAVMQRRFEKVHGT